eukprot:SAG31_NODE_2648_length_5299_cov_7.289615_3_plen_108_part_00
MDDFAKRSLMLGSVKGLRHVTFYLRGSEELIVRIRTPQQKPDCPDGSSETCTVSLPNQRARNSMFPPASPYSGNTEEVRSTLSCVEFPAHLQKEQGPHAVKSVGSML